MNGSTTKKHIVAGSTSSTPFRPSTSSGHDYSTLENEYKRRELAAQQAYEKLQHECNAKEREAERHQQERVSLLRQWEDLNKEVDEERASHAKQRKELLERVNELQEANNTLSTRVDEAEIKSAQSTQSEQSVRTELSIRVSSLESELAIAKEQSKLQDDERERLESQLQEQMEDFEKERRHLQLSQSDTTGSAQLTKELSTLLSKTRKLETENLTLRQDLKTLQARRDSVEALKEQIRDLEKRVSASDEVKRRLYETEAQLKNTSDEVRSWRQIHTVGRDEPIFEQTHMAFSDPDVDIAELEKPSALTSDTLRPYVARLQGAISGLTARAAALSDRMGSLKKRCADAEETSSHEGAQRQRLEKELDAAKTAQLKSDKASETMAMEVESYRRLLVRT